MVCIIHAAAGQRDRRYVRGKGQGVCPSNGDAMFETVGTWQLYFDECFGSNMYTTASSYLGIGPCRSPKHGLPTWDYRKQAVFMKMKCSTATAPDPLLSAD